MRSEPSRARRTLVVTVAVLIVLLGAAEWSARQALDQVAVFPRFARNHLRYRAWPEYMAAGLAETNRTRIVILTNCQGYGGELPARLNYAAEIEKNLLRRHALGRDNWRVLNWAIDGAESQEYVLMAAYLRRHPADVVLALTNAADFDASHFGRKLGACRSDVPRVLLLPGVATQLPVSFLRRHATVEDVLRYGALDLSGLLRSRELLWSWIDRWQPGVHNTLYAPAINYLPWMLPRREGTRPYRLPDHTVRAPRIVFDEHSETLLAEYVAQLARLGGRRALVAQPIRRDAFPGEETHFIEVAAGRCRADRLPFLDLRDLIEAPRYFSTVHLNRGAHVELAAVLADYVIELLSTPPEELPAERRLAARKEADGAL